MPRNVELKAKLADRAAALGVARELGAELASVEHQLDTYFTVPRGRLKLRRRWVAGPDSPPSLDPQVPLEHELPAELIAYFRPDEEGARTSDYVLAPLTPTPALEQTLGAILGVDSHVEKTRIVFLHENVRIHIDEVVGLGAFLEFEAIVDGDCDESLAGAKLDRLRHAFAVSEADILAGSYREMVG